MSEKRDSRSQEPAEPERLIKSGERVRDLGEVFTPRQTVDEMLDLLPRDMWRVHPSRTFLEPACGDGNFLVAILERKLERVLKAWKAGKVPAGSELDALSFHALESLASIYGVDISKDNIIGGVAEHPVGARDRIVEVFTKMLGSELGGRLNSRSKLLRTVQWVVEKNIQIGNMLPFDNEGEPSGWDRIPFLQYGWNPADLTLEVRQWLLGEIQDRATAANPAEGENMSLMAEAPVPEPSWRGRFDELGEFTPKALRKRALPKAA